MIQVIAAPRVRTVLAAALRGRLEHLPPAKAELPVEISQRDDGSELALRRVSVVLRARLRGRQMTQADQVEFSAMVRVIAERAGWDDLRYLDALNVCYESWPDGYVHTMRDDFLALYRAVLIRAIAHA